MTLGRRRGAAIEVEGVSKRFRLYKERNQSLKSTLMRRGRASFEEFWALRDVSLEVERGTTVGLIGSNGSGKSTLLKCMARILVPDKGAIRTHGKISALLELGSGFHPELSGRENVFLNGAVLGLRKREIEAKFDEIVEFSGIREHIDQPIKNYSSGMYVRLGFAVAINVDPEILLVDEVLAVGDEEFQRKCVAKFNGLVAEGRTVVVVSHSMATVETLCDKVALLERGRLSAYGSPKDVVEGYLSRIPMAGEEPGGAGEARLTALEILDGDGAPVSELRLGRPARFRIRFRAERPLEGPLFQLQVHSIEGTLVTSPNTAEHGRSPRCLSGEGSIEFRVERLPLVPGAYDLSAALYSDGGAVVHDRRNRTVRFVVEKGDPPETGGLVSFGGAWAGEIYER